MECEGKEEFKLLNSSGMKLKSTCTYSNTGRQRVENHPISSHYWPTSPPSSSFILPSWAHLSFPSLHPCISSEPQANTHTYTHIMTPPNLKHGSVMSSSTTDILSDREWLFLSLHPVYSGYTKRPKGWPLACPDWRHRRPCVWLPVPAATPAEKSSWLPETKNKN